MINVNKTKWIAAVIAFSLLGLSNLMTAGQASSEIVLDDTTLGQTVEAGETVTSDGVTMTVTSVVAADGGNSGTVEDWGILCGEDATSTDVVSLDISFDVDVRITDYVIGAREDLPDGVFITISGSNGTSGSNAVPAFDGFTEQEVGLSFAEGTLTVLKAGEPYTLSHNLSNFAGDPLFNLESLFVMPVLDWFSNASEIQPTGWLRFDWFKGFMPQLGSNWIFHGRHGWLFVLAEDTSNMFLWDPAVGRWFFTNETVYPWMYAYGPNEGWVFFFEGGRPGARFFKRGDTGQIRSEQQLNTTVTVLGAVNSPGSVSLPQGRELTLTEAIAVVRGIARLGDPNAVVIGRQSADGETKTMTVNFSSIASGDAPDITLEGGDTIFVPERII